jgi:hypothetical protein
LARFQSGPVEVQHRIGGKPPAASPKQALSLPIVYGKDFESEFDQFGYSPRFAPGTPSLDHLGRLLVRSDAFLQFEAKDGTWSFVDLSIVATEAISRLPDVKKFQWLTSHRSVSHDQTVYVDNKGRLFTLVQGSLTRLLPDNRLSGRPYLLVSSDAGKSWQAVALPVPDDRVTWRATLEHNDGNNDRGDPPPVLIFDQNDKPAARSAGLYLAVTKWQGERLAALPLVTVSDKSLLVQNHSGGANSLISTGDRVYIVYPGAQAVAGNPGTPAYMAIYDKGKAAMEGESLLGFSGRADKIDNHNIPGICLGRGGAVHVTMPGHQEDLFLLTGHLDSGRIKWGEAQQIGESKAQFGGYTYGSLNCDPEGNIVITSRWAGERYRFQLVLLQRNPAGQWLRTGYKKHQVLVDPGRTFYGVWRQRAAQASDGTLYLSYSYYANQLSEQELAALRRRFPFERWDIANEMVPAFCVRGAEPRCWRHPMPEVTHVLLKRSRSDGHWWFVQ